jgi:hypothetical protein
LFVREDESVKLLAAASPDTGHDALLALLNAIPTLLWVVLIGILIWKFYDVIRDRILPNVTSFKVFGIELEIARQQIDYATKQSNQSGNITDRDKSAVLIRADAMASVLRGAEILWVDDSPQYNVYERRFFHSLGIGADTASSAKEALNLLRSIKYDLVITDMRRDSEPTTDGKEAGAQLAATIHALAMGKEAGVPADNYDLPCLVYSAEFDPSRGTPPFVFGMTNRPDELAMFVMDILERVRTARFTLSDQVTLPPTHK